MKAGDLIFVRGHSLMDEIIRLFEPGPYTHVAVAVSPTRIIEAQYNRRVGYSDFAYTDYTVVDLNLTDEQREKVVQAADGLVGEWYNYLELFGIMFNNEKWTMPKALICTQVAIKLLQGIKFIPNEDMFPYFKPNEFYKFVMVDLPKIRIA